MPGQLATSERSHISSLEEKTCRELIVIVQLYQINSETM